jgi:ribosomal protein S18 acetylase RimI-like enzyme
MALRIREAEGSDYEELSALFEEGDAWHREHLPRVFQKPEGVVRSREYILDLLANDDVALFVAELGGRLVGLISAMIREAPDVPLFVPRRYAMIDNVVVRAGYRRAGIGRALMARVHEWAAEAGVDSVELHVWEFNEGAIEFYRELGYETSSRRMSRRLPKR